MSAVPIEKRLVLLVDLSALFRSAWHANPDGDVSIAFGATLDAVRRCNGLYPDAVAAICCDGRNNWRKTIAPTYKAQREKQPESLYSELERTKARLRDDGHLLWEFDGYEADDVIASACDAAVVSGCDVVIATHDKDALQLVRHGVKVLRTHTWVEVDAAKVTEKFGIEPYKLAGWQALTGDKSDNVEGAPGIGDVKATALIKRYGGISQLFMALEKEPDEVMRTPCGKGTLGPAAVLSLQQNRAKVELALKLVTPKYDVPLKFEELWETRDVKPLTNGEPMSDEPEDTYVEGMIATPVETAQDNVPTSDAKPAPAEPRTTALAVMAPAEFERQLEPVNPSGLMKLADVLFNSRMYPRFGSANAIAAVISRGRSLGLSSGAALDCIHWMDREGRMALHAHLIVALAEESPNCEYFEFIEGDETHATYETKHRKHKTPKRHTYTIDDAVAAGIATKEAAPKTAKPGEKDSRGNWDKRRKEMLRKTAAVQLVRMVYPSAALGLYSVAELGGDE